MSNKNVVIYQTDQGEVKLSHDIVKRYLVSGDADKVTDQGNDVYPNVQVSRIKPIFAGSILNKIWQFSSNDGDW